MLTLQNVSASYRKHQVLKDLSFHLGPGSITAVIGPNGAGKSTLLRCLTGEKQDYRGSILLCGKEVRTLHPKNRSQMVSCLPQELPCPHVTVGDLVSFGRSPYTPLTGHLAPRDQEAIQWALQAAGVADLQDTFLDKLSGGQQKKAFFAMTLAQDTPLVLLDEPTAHLDAPSRFAFLDLVEKMRLETGKSFLVVMHELPEVLRYAHRIVALDRGTVRFDGAPDAFLKSNLPQTLFGVRIHGSKEDGYSVLPLT